MKQLTRAEMRNIMGGTDEELPPTCDSCVSSSQCSADRSCRTGICPLDNKEIKSCFIGAGG